MHGPDELSMLQEQHDDDDDNGADGGGSSSSSVGDYDRSDTGINDSERWQKCITADIMIIIKTAGDTDDRDDT